MARGHREVEKLLRRLLAIYDADPRDPRLTLKRGASRADVERFLAAAQWPDDAPPDAPVVDEDEEA